MTKTEFLQQLYNQLMPLMPGERDDIISDFEEHFTAGIENGKTEEQICEELGNPHTCALQYLRQTEIKPQPASQVKAEQTPVYTAGQPVAQPPYNGEAVKGNPQRNHVLWSIMFALGVMAAIAVYPASIAFMVAFIGLIIASVFAGTFTASIAVGGFLVSIGVLFFAMGLFGFLFMTWFLKLSWRRAGL